MTSLILIAEPTNTANITFFFLSFFIRGGTHSVCMPALRPASQAGPMRNPKEGTSVVLCNTISVLPWLFGLLCLINTITYLLKLMVCVMCNYTLHTTLRDLSLYREVCRAKGGIRSGETLCHDIYPAWPITTVSLATNTYCTMDGHSSCAPRTVGPMVQFSGACKQSHWWPASAYSRRPSVISGSSSD